MAVLILLLAAPFARAQATTPAQVYLSDSISAVFDAAPGAPIDPHFAVISRHVLRQAEADAILEIEVALRMRNFTELQSRVQRGETPAHEAMAGRYLPLESDYEKVAAWLAAQNLTITRLDPNRMAVFASGKVRDIANIFGIAFARVTCAGGEYTSAVNAPSVPADVANVILGINGLQPHLQARHHAAVLQPDSISYPYLPPYLPSEIATAYKAFGNGSGQIIAVVDDAFPANSDLTQYWSTCGVGQSLNNIAYVSVNGGPPAHPSNGATQEATLDAEWTSSLASAAKVRIYGVSSFAFTQLDQAYVQILADQPQNPGLNQLSLSLGLDENQVSSAQLQTDDQYFAEMVSAGITVFASSGDDGLVQFPASDPNVIGVGGTTLVLNSNGTIQSETVWSNSYGSTGGGESGFFNRPSWQKGNGVPGGTTRCVPDVASSADPNYGGLVIVGGQQGQIGGTSWGCPTWAAFCAMINQGRANAGQSPIGLLGSNIYPLIGTSSFNDITNGSNGIYSAGPGYDLCSGIGTPNVNALSQALETVAASTTPASASGSSSSGGGGGAFDRWFLVALVFFCLLSWRRQIC